MLAVGFDFDHTLGIDNKLERRVALEMLDELARAQAVSYDPADAGAAVDEMLHQSRSGGMPLETALAGFFDRFVELGDKAPEVTEQYEQRVVALAPQLVEALPGLHEMLADLQNMGAPYAILTNGWSPLQEEKARLVGFEGPVFVSERIGVRKPSREAFEFLAKHFGAPPAAVWYVGDDPALDCAAARACGMTSVWFDWEGRSYPQELEPPNFVIHSLSELPALLKVKIKE
jgi:HAD superfamily hydrolase (TIGR01509 family)